TTKANSIPVIPILLTFGAVCGLTVLAERIYHHPRETMVDLIRAAMLLGGIRVETCNLAGVAMHYYCAGRRGTPVVLIHGLGSSAETWAALMPLLSKEYLVYAPDLPGFGRTPLAPEGTNIRTHVLYLERFLNALGYPRVTLVGNSLGGWIATRFAVEHPERVERLFLLNSAGLSRENMHSPYVEDRIEAMHSLEHLLGYSLPVPTFVLDALVRNSQTPAYAGFIRGYDPSEELDSVLVDVQAPTTIIWGERDNLLPLICAYDLHKGIANSELVLLPRVGHMPQIQNPARVAQVILQKLS
ncbi:MAG TPA: alpha/beta fold hydrolase, partial [Ktedonobacteraceae bacterium]|nr:alpha/beta fold hydrolase [Ktedonobacteraceae bacterium]